MQTHGLSTDRVITFSDAKLVDKTFEVIGQVDNDALGDALYFLVGELLERFAPEAARAEIERTYAGEADSTNLLGAMDALRERQTARRLRETLGGDDA